MAVIHHLNCGTLRPGPPGSAMALTGEGGWTETAELGLHALLIETDRGLILVDSGFGSADVADPRRPGMFFRYVLHPRVESAETAVEQVKSLGHSPAGVRHIVVTHLDADHAGGLSDFPDAQVHVFAGELKAALRPGIRGRFRYAAVQFAHGPRWIEHRLDGGHWFGLDATPPLPGLDPEIRLVALPGHSRGHCGVAIRTAKRWLFHCGDGYLYRREIEDPPSTPKGLAALEVFLAIDPAQGRQSRDALRRLASDHGEEIELFCTHDGKEFERLAQASSASLA